MWNGNYYAWELERVLGLAPHGGIRAGFLHYNDAADTERLLAAVAGASGTLSRRRGPTRGRAGRGAAP